MAQLNFPDPNVSTTYTEAGITWTWNATLEVWSSETDEEGGSSSISIGANPPGIPEDGDLWWADTDIEEGGGRLYVYTGDEWVDVSLPGNGFSGQYNDLEGKPNLDNLNYLSSVNDDTAAGKITFQSDILAQADIRTAGNYRNTNPLAAQNSLTCIQTAADHDNQDVTESINIVAAAPQNVSGNRLMTTGFQVNSSFNKDYTGARQAYGFKGNLAADAGGNTYNFYADGDAPNYFKGLTEHASGVKVTGGTAASVNTGLGSSFTGILNFNANGQEVGRVAGDRWVIGSADPAEKSYIAAYMPLRISQSGGNTFAVGASVSPVMDGNIDGSANVLLFNTYGQTDGRSVAGFVHFSANEATGSAVVGAEQAGFKAASTITSAAKNYGFQSDIAANGEKNYGFYAGGSAPNYFAGHTYFNQNSTLEPGTGNTTTGACMRSSGSGCTLFMSRGDNLAFSVNRNSSGLIGQYRLSGAPRGEVVVSSGGCNWNSVTSFSARTEVPEFTDAASVISQLKAGRDGFAAEDIEAYMPGDWVYRSENEVMFDNTRLIPILTKALQEALTRIEELESNTLQPLYATLADLPDASAHHGKVAHVHSEGALYFAHAGNWVKLQNA